MSEPLTIDRLRSPRNSLGKLALPKGLMEWAVQDAWDKATSPVGDPADGIEMHDLAALADAICDYLETALAAQPSAEPGLDVERLAMAIPYPMMRRDEPWADFATRTAEYIAEKYAALIPDRPTPTDRLTEARDEAAYWRRQAIEAQRREGA